MKKITKLKIIEYAKSIAIAVAIAFFIRTFLLQPFKIPSESMLNTLKIGDHLFVLKFIYGTKIPFTDISILPVDKPDRGDIIVFEYPMDKTKDYIKRCIAVPKDKIQIINKTVYVNDKPLKEPYAIHTDDIVFTADVAARDNYGPLVVPEDKYFMMGDNRDNSSDSRVWGLLDKKYIIGRAVLIYWPIWRIGLIK